jgi:hypothetical protein
MIIYSPLTIIMVIDLVEKIAISFLTNIGHINQLINSMHYVIIDLSQKAFWHSPKVPALKLDILQNSCKAVRSYAAVRSRRF